MPYIHCIYICMYGSGQPYQYQINFRRSNAFNKSTLGKSCWTTETENHAWPVKTLDPKSILTPHLTILAHQPTFYLTPPANTPFYATHPPTPTHTILRHPTPPASAPFYATHPPTPTHTILRHPTPPTPTISQHTILRHSAPYRSCAPFCFSPPYPTALLHHLLCQYAVYTISFVRNQSLICISMPPLTPPPTLSLRHCLDGPGLALFITFTEIFYCGFPTLRLPCIAITLHCDYRTLQ